MLNKFAGFYLVFRRSSKKPHYPSASLALPALSSVEGSKVEGSSVEGPALPALSNVEVSLKAFAKAEKKHNL